MHESTLVGPTAPRADQRSVPVLAVTRFLSVGVPPYPRAIRLAVDELPLDRRLTIGMPPRERAILAIELVTAVEFDLSSRTTTSMRRAGSSPRAVYSAKRIPEVVGRRFDHRRREIVRVRPLITFRNGASLYSRIDVRRHTSRPWPTVRRCRARARHRWRRRRRTWPRDTLARRVATTSPFHRVCRAKCDWAALTILRVDDRPFAVDRTGDKVPAT